MAVAHFWLWRKVVMRAPVRHQSFTGGGTMLGRSSAIQHQIMVASVEKH
jgi:hypothetical protein